MGREIMEPRQASLLKVQMFNNKICAFKEGKPNSQFVVKSGKSWRTGSASGQVAGSVTSKESDEKQHSRWPCLSGIQSEPAYLG